MNGDITVVEGGKLTYEARGKLDAKMDEIKGQVSRDPSRFDSVLYGLQQIVEGRAVVAGKYPIFMSVEVGYKNVNTLLAALANSGANVSDMSRQVLSKEKYPGKKRIINVAKVYPDKDFGLSGWVSKDKVYAAAHANGLVDLVPEAGMAVEIKYVDQPNGELAYIGMKPVDVNGYLLVLCLRRSVGGDRWVDCSNADRVCDAESPWLFGVPQ